MGFLRRPLSVRPQPRTFTSSRAGEIPRLDALQRICRGLGITEEELIIGMTRSKPAEPAAIVLEMKKG